MTNKMPHLLLCLYVLLAIGIAGIAQQSATEAPAGFETPTFTPTLSVSNGMPEPAGEASHSTSRSLNKGKTSTPVWAPYLTRPHASIVIRIL